MISIRLLLLLLISFTRNYEVALSWSTKIKAVINNNKAFHRSSKLSILDTTVSYYNDNMNAKQQQQRYSSSSSKLLLSDSPSDYDTDDLLPIEKTVSVDENEEDEVLRDALKRELLLLASTTSRGECATQDEKDIMLDLVTQLEALNPTSDPAMHCEGDWDLCLASTQFFRSSPFFMAIRSAVGDDNKSIAETGFDIHDKATKASRVGKVRQTITYSDTTTNELISEVDLDVGLLPGIPFNLRGTVVTKAAIDVEGPGIWNLSVKSTSVTASDIEIPFELPVGDAYKTITGSVPVSVVKTFYVDESIRIFRDVDDNYFVFVKA